MTKATLPERGPMSLGLDLGDQWRWATYRVWPCCTAPPHSHPLFWPLQLPEFSFLPQGVRYAMCTEEASGLCGLLCSTPDCSSSQGRSRTRAGGAGVQEGGRTSWRCSPARTGQYQDHSQAGTGAQMLGWQARFPGQSFVGFLSLDGVHESLVEVCKAQARDVGSVW